VTQGHSIQLHTGGIEPVHPALLPEGWDAQARCCNRLLHICWSIVLALGWQARWSNLWWLGPQWNRKLMKITSHLSWSKRIHRDSTSDQMMHYNSLIFG